MQEEQKQNAKDNLTDSDKNIPADSSIRKDTPSEHAEPEDQKENTTHINKEPYKIIVNIPEKKDKAANTANVIAIINVGIAAALAIGTFLLFSQAHKDSGTAEKSAQAAQDAVKEQRLNDSITRYRDSTKSYHDSVDNRKKFIIDSTSTHTQIDALNSNKIQFEISNMAFVTVGNPKIVLDSNKIIFDIISIGHFPIELNTGIYGIELKKEIPIEKEKKTILLEANTVYTDIMVQGMNKPTTLDYHNRFQGEKMNDFMSGKVVFYFGGRIRFTNLSTFKKYNYYFLEEITTLPTLQISLIYQKTYPARKY